MSKARDPVRLAEDASTSPPLADALRLAQSGPDARALERMASALGVAAPIAPPPVPPASGLATSSGLSIPALGVVALAGAVGAGAALGLAPAPAPESSAPPARAVPVVSTPERRPEAAPLAEIAPPAEAPPPQAPAPSLRRRRVEPEPPAVVAEASPPAPEPSAVPAATDAASRLREEALLVRNADRLLGSDPARALALTEERRQRFPGGALAQEAEVVAIDALLRLGRRDAAAARARAFEARHPGSLHARRVRALFGSNP